MGKYVMLLHNDKLNKRFQNSKLIVLCISFFKIKYERESYSALKDLTQLDFLLDCINK